MRCFIRLCALSTLLLCTMFSFATDYTFTGSGDWTIASNWQGNLIPPNLLPAGSTITVTGTAVVTNCSLCPILSSSNGAITVAAGGSLTLQNNTQFSLMAGSLVVNGTLVNQTTFEVYSGAAIVVNGTFNNTKKSIGNQGAVTINSGGVFNNQSNAIFTNTGFPPGFVFLVTGTLTVNAGGTFTNSGTAVLRAGNLTNNGTISNTSVMDGNAAITGSLTNGGTLSPGNSPGLYTVSGDYTATPTAIQNFEVGGTPSSSYDRLNVSGNVNLAGSLNVSLINGFVPSASNPDLPLITGTINGTFATVTKPAQYQLVYTASSVMLRYLAPLPVTFTNIEIKKEGSDAKLIWRVQGEANLSHYEIEKSTDARQFVKAGEVGASFLSQYSFVDRPLASKTFYRVKSLDKDGRFTYSVVLTYSEGKSVVGLSVFPSPAKGMVYLQHPTATAGARIVLSGVDGRVVETIRPLEGVQKTKIDASGFPAGFYLVRFYDGTALVETAKLLLE